MIQELREAGLNVEYSLVAQKGDRQFKRAMELGARRTVRLEKGPDDAAIALVKDLTTRVEFSVPPGELKTVCAES